MIKLRNPDNKELTTVYGNKIDYVRESKSDPKYYDEYRNLWKKVTNMEIVTDFPLQLDFELNNSCNFSYISCPWSETRKNNKILYFSFDLYKKILDDAVVNGLKAIRLNYINEPLIRKDIIKFIKYAKKNGILDIYLSTNGFLLSKEMSKNLITSGLTRLQVSVDAYTAETYNKIRFDGNFEKILQNINIFLETRRKMDLNVPTLRVNFVRSSINLHELNDFISYWTDKSDSIGIQDIVDVMGIEKIENKNKIQNFKCSQPFQHLTIRYDGTVQPCCSLFGTGIPIANIKTETIKEIWNGTRMKFYRNIHKTGQYFKDSICKKCVESTVHS